MNDGVVLLLSLILLNSICNPKTCFSIYPGFCLVYMVGLGVGVGFPMLVFVY